MLKAPPVRFWQNVQWQTVTRCGFPCVREPFDDPLLVFSVLNSFWAANYTAFDGDAMRELAVQFMAVAEKQGATVPLMVGHRIMGTSLMETGDIVQGRAHYDHAIALYDPNKKTILREAEQKRLTADVGSK